MVKQKQPIRIVNSIQILFLLTIIIVIPNCKLDPDFCRLTKLDKEYNLAEFDSISYLENDSAIVVVEVSSQYEETWYTELYITTGGFEWTSSSFYLPDDFRKIWLSSSACKEYAYLAVINTYTPPARSDFNIRKDTLTNLNMRIQGKIYRDCFVFKDTTDIKELIYCKDYGVLKLELLNGYKLEILDYW